MAVLALVSALAVACADDATSSDLGRLHFGEETTEKEWNNQRHGGISRHFADYIFLFERFIVHVKGVLMSILTNPVIDLRSFCTMNGKYSYAN